nr:hypothetical protein [Paenibacillus polymyxa]
MSFYNAEEPNQLLAVIRGERIELFVILAAFYGLSRSEAVGLKWSAIDLLNWTINIKHTATSGNLNGIYTEIEKGRTKNKSIFHILTLVDTSMSF